MLLGAKRGCRPSSRTLTSAVEKSDRIRELAVNPLLLTVIAIEALESKEAARTAGGSDDRRASMFYLGQRKEAERSTIYARR